MRYLFIIGLFCLASESLAYKGGYKYWKPKKPLCSPVKCDEKKCYEEKGPNGCPVCKCEPKCEPLMCKPPCKVIEDDICPTCVCDIEEPDLELDARRGKDKKCGPVKCPPGCHVEKFFEGPCPGCECEDEDEFPDIKVPAEIACYPPKCPPGCKLQKEFKGPCPGCDCEKEELEDFPKIACSMPKCPPGCKLEKVFKGPCPGCDCKERMIPEPVFKMPKKKMCAPVKCLPGCEVITEGPEECPKCKCKKPMCVPPKCGFGCELDKDPKVVCPGCICKKDFGKEIFKKEIKVICPPVEKCMKPGCELVEDEKGCKFCKCGPICDPPKCPRRCTIKVLDGKCPECVCPSLKWWKKKP